VRFNGLPARRGVHAAQRGDSLPEIKDGLDSLAETANENMERETGALRGPARKQKGCGDEVVAAGDLIQQLRIRVVVHPVASPKS
jgi:hypothetical protein